MLCYESNLYPILLAFNKDYYEWNRSNLNRGLYLNRALYSSDVVFERDGESRKADVLSCAAPNFRVANRYQGISKSENEREFKDRIKFMYQVAEDNGVEILIAGAWGCGVFGQDSRITCRLMIESLIEENYKIREIDFVIPDRKNYCGFKEELERLS